MVDPNSYKSIADLAEAYADAGQFTDAIDAYQRAIREDPDNAALHHDLALVFDEIGDFDKAESTFKHALAIQPNLYIAYYNLGLLYKEHNLPDLAVRCFEKSIDQKQDLTTRKDSKYEIDNLKQDLDSLTDGSTPDTPQGKEPASISAKYRDLEELDEWTNTSRSYRQMRGALRLIGMLTFLLGVLGLAGVLINSLGSLSFLIIGLMIVLMPVRSMFLALAVQGGWWAFQLTTNVVLLPQSEAALCLIPTTVGLTIFVLVLYFRFRNTEKRYLELLIDRDPRAIPLEIRIGNVLSWTALILGLSAFVSLVVALIAGSGISLDSLQDRILNLNFDSSYMLSSTLAHSLAVAGFAICVSSLANSRTGIVKALTGMIFSSIVLFTALLGTVSLWWLFDG